MAEASSEAIASPPARPSTRVAHSVGPIRLRTSTAIAMYWAGKIASHSGSDTDGTGTAVRSGASE